jgi:hypothetical protein
MRHQLGQNPAGPVIAEPGVTFSEISHIPGPDSPLKCLEPVKIIGFYQGL